MKRCEKCGQDVNPVTPGFALLRYLDQHKRSMETRIHNLENHLGQDGYHDKKLNRLIKTAAETKNKWQGWIDFVSAAIEQEAPHVDQRQG